MILYNYARSSASTRVRIGLALKGLPYEYRSVSLRDGEQHSAAYRALNPQGLVPLLVDGDVRISQSLAILEYLDERYPDAPLLPPDPGGRARVRSLAQHIACEIQPLQNLRVTRHVVGLGLDDAAWSRHWITSGFAELEPRVGGDLYCHGDTPGLADCVLVPQVNNARRLGVDLAAYPRIHTIWERCVAHPAFVAAAPEAQPDFR